MFNWINKLLPGTGKPAASDPLHAVDAPLSAVQRDESTTWQKRGNAFLGDGDLRQAFDCYQRALAIHPGYADACISLAYVLMEESKPQEAEPYLDRALRIDPANADVHYMLGSITSSRNDVAAAIDHWHAALELRPDFDRAWQDLLDALYRNGQAQRAKEILHQAINRQSQRADLHLYLANVHVANEEFDDAIACYGRVLTIRPDHLEAMNGLGLAYQRRNRHNEAIATFRRLLEIQPDSWQAHFNLGNALKAKNAIPEAIAHYHRALSIHREDADVHVNLGNALQADGDLAAAADSYRQALQIKPDDVFARNNLGLVLDKQGKHDDAVALFNQALAIEPNNIGVRINLALAWQAQEKFDTAIDILRRSIDMAPDSPEAHFNLANILKARGKVTEAITHYRKALSIDPELVDAHLNLGSALQSEDKLEEAIASYRRALAIEPDYVLAYNNLGLALGKRKEYEDAIALFEKALDIDPNDPVVHNNLGHVLLEQGKLDAAIRHLRRAIEIKPDQAEAFQNLGNALTRKYESETALVNENNAPSSTATLPQPEQDLREAAIECFRRAVSINPDYAAPHVNLGLAFQGQGRLEEARECYHRALAIDPDFAEAHWNEGLCLLLMGDLEKGWGKYEWRWKNEQLPKPPIEFSQPRWHGHEPLQGKTILLWAEQGLGDTMQFSRYANMVAARGATVFLAGQAALKPLLRKLPGVSRVVTEGEPLPTTDYHCPLLSLPLAFRTTIDTIPVERAYFSSDPAWISAWRDRLGSTDRMRVGVVWSGNAIHANDHNRSIPFARFQRLFSDRAQFFSLQKEVRPIDAPALEACGEITHFGSELKDFADTAGLVANMDLVISVDTSVAHLAASMGKPVWVLLPFAPDWRWILGRDDCPWYPSVRLFRQPSYGDWESTILAVGEELRKMMIAKDD
jgi:tetratricopeptide (TPR) repeat protein